MKSLQTRVPDVPSSMALARLLAQASGLLSAPIVARALGPEGRGETATALAMFYLAPIIIGLGVTMETRRRAAIEPVGPILRAARLWCLLGLIPSCLLGVAGYVYLGGEMSPINRTFVAAGVALAPLAAATLCDVSVLVAQNRYRSVAYLILIHPVSYLIQLILLFAVTDLTVASVLGTYLVSTICAFALGYRLVAVPWRGETHSVHRLATGSMKYAGSSISEAASNRLDQILAIGIIGATEAGYYAVAVTVAALPIGIAHAMSAGRFSELAALRNAAKRPAVASAAYRECLVMCGIAVLGLAIVTPVAIPIVFGPEFGPAIVPTLVLLIGGLLSAQAFMASMTLVSADRGWRMTASQLGALAVSISLLIALGQAWGALGAAAASATGSGLLLLLLTRSLGLGWSDIRIRGQDLGAAWRSFNRAGGNR